MVARQTIAEFLAAEAEEAELHRDDPPGPMFRSKHPSIDPSHVYSVRIPVAKLEQLRLLAIEAGISQSELIRQWTLERLDATTQGHHTAGNE